MDPRNFVRTELPKLFSAGIALLERRSGEGDAEAKARLEDIRGASATARVTFEGDRDVFVSLERATMQTHDEPPPSPPISIAIAAPKEAASHGLDELGSLLKSEEAALAVAGLGSKRAEQQLAGQSLLFHVLIKEVPDLGDVRIRVALNGSEAPTTPKFTAALKFDDLERVRDGELAPAQLVTGGKIKWSGDYAKAMSLAIQMAPKTPRKR